MAYRNLDEFFIRLEQEGELIHIKKPVNIDTDITQITLEMRDSKGNKALWFDNVIGYDMPVVTNIFTTPKRVAWALGVDDVSVHHQKMDTLIMSELPANFSGLMGRAGEFMGMMRNIVPTHTTSCKSCVQDVIKTGPAEINVTKLPIIKNHTEDSGRFLTLAQLITFDATSNQHQHQLVNAQIINATTLRIPNNTLHLNSIQQKVPSAIAIGGDPAEICATLAPLPTGFNPYQLAGWLRNRPINIMPAVTQPLNIPSDAEIVIEGWIDTQTIHTDNTFANETGQYVVDDAYVTMHITAITHRKDAVYPAFIPTIGEVEGFRQLITRMFLPVLKLLIDGLIDLNLPALAGDNTLAIVSVNKRFNGQAQQTMYALWGLGELARLKTIIIVDHDIEVNDVHAVMEHVLSHTQWNSDLTRVEGILPAHDQAKNQHGLGTKLGIDATRKTPDTPPRSTLEINQEALNEAIGTCWDVPITQTIIISQVDLDSDASSIFTRVWKIQPDHNIILIDDPYEAGNLTKIATKALVNIDWGTDTIINSADKPNHTCIGIDARSKKQIKWVDDVRI